MKLKKFFNYFTLTEKILWTGSVVLITLAFVLFDRVNYLTFIASLIGVTSLIFCAKGNPIGQFLMIIFGIIYGIISYGQRYFGEMITYMGMTLPMSIFSLITWLKNPFLGKKSQVKINLISVKEILIILSVALGISVGFYFLLRYFNTANLIVSTISVTTSFVAVCLTFRRSAFFALAYALNDVVLIVLWTISAIKDLSYLSVVICFIVFLINDLYGFINWQRNYLRQKRQSSFMQE